MLVSIKRWALGSKKRQRPGRLGYYTTLLYYTVIYYTALRLITRLSPYLAHVRVPCRGATPPPHPPPLPVDSRSIVPAAAHDDAPMVDGPGARHLDARSTPHDPPAAGQESFVSRHLSELSIQISELSRHMLEISRRLGWSLPAQSDGACAGTRTGPCDEVDRRFGVGSSADGPRPREIAPASCAPSDKPAETPNPNYVTSGAQFIHEMATQLRTLDATAEATLRRASALNACAATQSAVVVDNSRLILSHAHSQHESTMATANATATAYVKRRAIPSTTGLFEDMVISVPLGVIFGPT